MKSATINFVKAQGAGNDFVITMDSLPLPAQELAPRLCDRKFGIGADGLIVISDSSIADFKMRYFNADGSEAICNNGMRCSAKYLKNTGALNGSSSLLLEVHGNATVAVKLADSFISTEMGEPQFKADQIPLNSSLLKELTNSNECIEVPMSVHGQEFIVTAVGMGNPHCVIFSDDIDKLDLETLGPAFENHPLFPERTNVEFVEVLSSTAVRERTWERGVGETLACGSGNCAVVAAGVKTGRLARGISLNARGGDFELNWSEETNRVNLSGPAELVYSGEINV